MLPTARNRFVLVLAAITSAVGALDAAFSREWDLFAVFALTLLLLVVLLVQLGGRRQTVLLRADLVAWLRARASRTGEPMEAVAERAIATYRLVYDEDAAGDGAAAAADHEHTRSG
ncbi:MAG: hypothetical protein S0880_18135 [Actinomycetota bacterium]|nr:hypothetical protein [Actinomycetota bacterium]